MESSAAGSARQPLLGVGGNGNGISVNGRLDSQVTISDNHQVGGGGSTFEDNDDSQDLEQQVSTVNSTPLVKHVHSRLVSLDLFRGLIVAIMAWDHVTHQYTDEHDLPSFGFEGWEGPYAAYDGAVRKFLTRNVSHICAPGFFFTMGISMVLFTISRRERLVWTWGRVFMHHFVRGCILLLVEYIIDFPSALPKLVDLLRGREVKDWTGNDYDKGDEGKMLYRQLFSVYEVMTALGFSMMLAQLAMPLMFKLEAQRHRSAEFLGWALFVLCFAISNIAIVTVQGDNDLTNYPEEFPHFGHKAETVFEMLARTLLFPGKLMTNWQTILYPVFPWIGVTFLGMGYGFVFKADAERAHKLLRNASPILFTCFLLVRGLGGRLNYRGYSRGEESVASSFMQFFIQTKYPPDWAFATITLSVVFLFIFLFNHELFWRVDEDEGEEDNQQESDRPRYLICQWKEKGWRHPLYPLLVFGRTPLFFYAVHFWIIATSEAIFRIPNPPSGKFRLYGVFLVWVVLMLVMYQLCKMYLKFKSSTHPGSLWRMF